VRHLDPAVRLSETAPYWTPPSVPLGLQRARLARPRSVRARSRSSSDFYSRRVAVEVAQPVLTN
jgi:hypothetical protein